MGMTRPAAIARLGSRTAWAGLLAALSVVPFIVPSDAAASGTSPSGGRYPPITTPAPGNQNACSRPVTVSTIPAAKMSAAVGLLSAFVGTRLQSIGPCANGLITLSLTPASEPLAKRVRAIFGPAVIIGIGLTAWDGKPGRSPVCGSLPQNTSDNPGFRATLSLRSTRIASGAELMGSVLLRGTSSVPVQANTGSPIEVVITKPHSRRVVGTFSGGIAGVGYGVALSQGATKAVSIVGGTARCDGGLGSALPPGHYDAVAEVSGPAIDGTQPPIPPIVFTQFEPIQIVR
jgi:hypothetical protein